MRPATAQLDRGGLVLRRPPARRLRLIIVLGLVAACAVAGSWLLADRLAQSRQSVAASANLSGLDVRLQDAGWVAMEAHLMDQQGGYQMPAQMMPGAPAGDEMRLGISVTLMNTSGNAQGFKLTDEFHLIGGTTTAPVALHSDTFGLLGRLNPGNAVNGVLYFDTIVPAATDPPLTLRWTRGDETVDLAIPFAGAAPPTHDHGP